MRWKFIDQFRGFAILGMIFVNVCCEFHNSPYWLVHHQYGFTFADFVAPAFIFIVGFSYRLSFMKAIENAPKTTVRKKFIKRYIILTFLGFLYGFFDFYVSVWDALTDIGISGLLLYPFIGKNKFFILFSGTIYLLVYQILFSFTPYGNWLMAHSIDGGPLGPLSWVFILASGAFCAVLFEKETNKISLSTLLYWLIIGLLLTGLGYILTKPLLFSGLPFTQRGMTASYSIFSSGLCIIALSIFYIINEKLKLTVNALTTMGKNPLVLYFLQAILIFILKISIFDKIQNIYLSHFISAFVILFICYIVAKTLEVKSIFVKV